MDSPEPVSTSWEDKLTIETPEQTSLEFPLAGVGSRCMALALDTLIQTGVMLILVLILLLIHSFSPEGPGGLGLGGLWAQAILYFTLFVVYFGYFAFFEAIWNGQTPGKRVAQLRVIQESGRPIQVWQAMARNLMRLVDSIPSFYAVGMASMLISKQNRRLGDFVAGTVVVHERPLTKISVGWASEAPGAVSGGNLGASRLSMEEARLIEAFLERRNSLAEDVRFRMARQIAARIAGSLGMGEDRLRMAGVTSDESFLETLARERLTTRGR
jgi:uncharacterized RDD family membrane protein YckC